MVGLTLWTTSILDPWEYNTWSWRVKTLAKPSESTAKIKVILIDQASLDWAANEMKVAWQWPRELYGPILDFCRRGGAKVIAFDMLYSEPSAYMVADDVLFGEAIGRGSNFVTAFFMGDQAGQSSNWPDNISRPSVTVKGLDAWLAAHPGLDITEPRATFPIPEVATKAAMLANVKEVPDHDGTFRRATPVRIFDGSTVPFLGFAAYLVADAQSPHELNIHQNALHIGSRSIPLDVNGQTILNFRGRSGTHESLSAAAIMQSELRILEGEKPVIDPEELKDTYIFFGVSAPGLKDLKSVPISGDYPGVEVHATFLDNLLEQDFIRDAQRGQVVFVTLLFSILAGVLIVRSRSVAGSVLWAGLFFAAPIALGFLQYTMNCWWPIMVVEISVLLAIGLGEIVNYATEGRQKRFIKSAFKQYLSGDVIEQILVDPSALKLGGEKRELSIFFSDLQGFSAISEKLGPVALTALLNDYLTDMSDIIMEEGGTVDKYEGDAIIAFWNAPLAQPDHAIRACRAALRCQRKLAERRKEFYDRTGVDMFMRIGIHTGEVVVGNMGSNNRFNYTVLGDAANLASRLEGANKQFGTYFMVSEVTWAQAKTGFFAREIGSIMVVGRKAPVRVYDVLGEQGEAAPPLLEKWSQVLMCCQAGQWAEALKLIEEFGDDPLAVKYRNQLKKLVSGEIPSWDGIWKLTEK